MKNNKTLKYTGIIQGVLIATLLLLAIWIQVTFLYNTYYCEDYSFDFLRNVDKTVSGIIRIRIIVFADFLFLNTDLYVKNQSSAGINISTKF